MHFLIIAFLTTIKNKNYYKGDRGKTSLTKVANTEQNNIESEL